MYRSEPHKVSTSSQFGTQTGFVLHVQDLHNLLCFRSNFSKGGGGVPCCLTNTMNTCWAPSERKHAPSVVRASTRALWLPRPLRESTDSMPRDVHDRHEGQIIRASSRSNCYYYCTGSHYALNRCTYSHRSCIALEMLLLYSIRFRPESMHI